MTGYSIKRYKNTYYTLTPTGILFPSSITKDRKQIFVTCRELNNENIALINGKVYNILGIIKGKIIVGKYTFYRTGANKQ